MHYCPSCGTKNKMSYNFCYRCGKRLNYSPLVDERIKQVPSESKSFKINDYLTLRLKKGKTLIYVKGEKFLHCKYLLIEIPKKKIQDLQEINSIDEASESLDHYLEDDFHGKLIPAELEFWGHSSNLQAWAEHDYDTRLLHSNIAFPLLKKLTEVGDPQARKVFKEEIAKRIESGYENVISYLINENYLDYFNSEELSFIVDLLQERIEKNFKEKYGGVLVSNELNAILDIIRANIFNSKNLKIKRFKILDTDQKETQLGFKLEDSRERNSNSNQQLHFTLKDHRIIKMNLINCGIRILPPSIGVFEELRELNLMWNEINALPEEIGDLGNLQVLNLSANKIATLPGSIGTMKSLKVLKLDHNRLSSLPGSIKELQSLRVLHLWNNQLGALPEEIGNLRGLEILGLSHNRLKEVPNELVKLKSLKTLDLSNNMLEVFPSNLEELESLRVLWLNHNRLTSLPMSLASLKSLKQLYLFLNPLEKDPRFKLKELVEKLESKGVNIRVPRFLFE